MEPEVVATTEMTPESLIEACIANNAAHYKPPDPYFAMRALMRGFKIGIGRAKWLLDAYALANPGVFLKYRPRTATNAKLWIGLDLFLAGLNFYWCSQDVIAGRWGWAVFFGLIGIWCLWAIVVSFRYIQFLRDRGLA